ncbi:acyltransferase [Methylobacterium mesophilicum]|uniref:acyltransferase family protein n=1 Tax=Methylobacterium mesophilicum TaxID=39956 RepID=UPI002F2D5570
MSIPTPRVERGDRGNNFGSLRIAFALLVIIGHAPELIDGDRGRDFLVRMTGSFFSGDLAVDGFFLISGYLITKSLQSSRSLKTYLSRRVARIYPGFIAAFIVSMLLFGSLAGGTLSDIPVVKSVTKLFILGLPVVPGAFAGLPHPDLNGSMWTISYEFRCYLFVIGIGALSTFAGRRYCLRIIVGIGVLYGLRHAMPDIPHGSPIFGSSSATIRLTFIFLVGSAFYIWRDVIRLTHRGALLALIACTGLLFVPRLAEPAFAIFGGYLIFWYALATPANHLSQWVDRTDPSYGLYLYAWPTQNLLIQKMPGITPLLLIIMTIPIAFCFGIASWHCIERRFVHRNEARQPNAGYADPDVLLPRLR